LSLEDSDNLTFRCVNMFADATRLYYPIVKITYSYLFSRRYRVILWWIRPNREPWKGLTKRLLTGSTTTGTPFFVNCHCRLADLAPSECIRRRCAKDTYYI